MDLKRSFSLSSSLVLRWITYKHIASASSAHGNVRRVLCVRHANSQPSEQSYARPCELSLSPLNDDAISLTAEWVFDRRESQIDGVLQSVGRQRVRKTRQTLRQCRRRRRLLPVPVRDIVDDRLSYALKIRVLFTNKNQKKKTNTPPVLPFEYECKLQCVFF